MLSDSQKLMLSEIERLVADIRLRDQPCDQEVIPVTGSLQAAINAAPEGAILDLIQREHLAPLSGFNIDKPLTLRNGTMQAPPNCNDILILRGSRIRLEQGILIRGDGTTKRGIRNDATFVEIDQTEIRNICRVGQETQALAMWNSPGPLKVTNSVLEAGSIPFLAGGSTPTIPDTVATNLLFENCLFTRPLAWKAQNYACKNAFELKSAQDVVVRNCILENVWAQGQAGSAIVLTAVNYGNSPNAVVQRVLFEGNIIRNVGNGLNGLGFGQQEFPTLRGNDWEFLNNNWEITRTNGGHGTLMLLAKGPENVVWEGGNVVQDGDAFIRMSEPVVPINGFSFRNITVNKPGTYGIFTPAGVRGINWQTTFPGGIMEGNTFYAAHTTFKNNFPNNTYLP